MKKIVDERILGLQQKYGFEALFISSLLMFIDFMVRIIFYKKGFFESIDLYFVMILPWIYYSIRGLFGGIFVNRSRREKIINKVVGVFFAIIFLVVCVFSLSNDGVLDFNSKPAFFTGFATGLLIVAVISVVLFIIARKHQKKFEEE